MVSPSVLMDPSLSNNPANANFHVQVFKAAVRSPDTNGNKSSGAVVHSPRSSPHQLNFFIIPPQCQRSPSRAVAHSPSFIPASFFCLYHPPTYLPQVSPFITVIHLQICRAALHAPSTIPPILSFFVHLHRPPT
jgi:hypothetical protein